MTMKKCHRTSGQALSFTLVCALVLIIFGIGIIFLIKIFGGTGEQHNATDSGVLNLNKTAVAQSVSLPSSYLSQHQFIAMYGQSAGLIGNDGSMKVNLGTFNNMIGAALIVALNASADGMSGTSGGQTNASNVIKDLEISDDSVGGRLNNLLQDTNPSNSDWAASAFSAVALANSERMLGKDAQATWDKSQYQVAYLMTPTTDQAASNVALDQFTANMPFTYDGSGKVSPFPAPKSIAADGSSYLRGYQAINIPNISNPIYAVPTQPGQQPHLISMVTFGQGLQSPGTKGVVLPPNAFKAGATSKNEIANAAQGANAAGIVGMPTGGTQASIPHGFLVIDNSLNPHTSVSIPTGDTWDAVEGCTGTLVYRPSHIFSTESTVKGQPYNALSSWLQTPRSGNFNPESGPPIVDDNGNALLYDSGGNPITTKADAAKQIPFDTNASDVVLATNQNSDPNGANPDSDCVVLATPTLPDNLSPFNRAYHPNANATSGSTSPNLTSAEQAKVYVLDLWQKYRNAGNLGGSFSGKTFPETGLRLYPGGKLPSPANPYAYAPPGGVSPTGKLPINHFRVSTYGDPSVLGKVTIDGTMQQLIQQTTQGLPYTRVDGLTSHVIKQQPSSDATAAAEIRSFIKQRMNEIHPTVSDGDVDRVFQQSLPLGSIYYVYYYQKAWVVSSSPPPWATYIPTPDGVRHAFTAAFEASGSMIDVLHDFGSNTYPFNTNNVSVKTVDCASYQSSSGANGLLGYIKFFEQAVPSSQ